MDPKFLDAAAQALSRIEAQEAEEALGWLLVVTHDDVPATHYGLHADPVAAMQVAGRFQEELNRDGPDVFRVTVAPLLESPTYDL